MPFWSIYTLRSAQYANRWYVGMEPETRKGQRQIDHSRYQSFLGTGDHILLEPPDFTMGDIYDAQHREMVVLIPALKNQS